MHFSSCQHWHVRLYECILTWTFPIFVLKQGFICTYLFHLVCTMVLGRWLGGYRSAQGLSSGGPRRSRAVLPTSRKRPSSACESDWDVRSDERRGGDDPHSIKSMCTRWFDAHGEGLEPSSSRQSVPISIDGACPCLFRLPEWGAWFSFM